MGGEGYDTSRRWWEERRRPAKTPQHHPAAVSDTAPWDLSAPKKRERSCTQSEKCILDISKLMCIQIHLQSSDILIKQGVAEKSWWWPGLPVKRIGPKQINPNTILVVVRHSMKRLLIYPWNKTLLYICLSEWSNPVMLTKCQKYHADHKNALSVFGSYVIHSRRSRQDRL